MPAATGADEDLDTYEDPPATSAPKRTPRKSQSKARTKAQDFVDDVDPYDDDFDDDDEYGYEDEYDDDPAPRRRSQRMKNCPVCGAQVKAKAVKCRHCGEELDDDDDRPRPSRPGRSRRRSGSRRSGPQDVTAGEIISDAWQIYTDNMGMIIGLHFLTIVMIGMLYLVSYISMALMFVGGFAALGAGGAGAAGLGVVAVLGLVVFFSLILVGFAFFHVGLKLSIFNVVTGKGGEISDLFQGGPYLLRFVGASILFSLAYTFGVALCVVPGILVMLMFWPYLYALFDRDAGAVDCLTDAKAATDGNWGTVLVLFLFVLGINLAGALACGVGQLFTIPLAAVVWCVGYCRMADLDVDV